MKIAFIMPTYFAPNSVIAGGERYAYGIAKAISEKTEASIFTFSDRSQTLMDGKLTVCYSKAPFYVGGVTNPFSLEHLKTLKDFDVIHCLQFKTIVTEMAIFIGAVLKKKVFVTDLAGGTYYCLSYLFPTEKLVREFLYISEFNRGINRQFLRPSRVIYGGVDTEFFSPSPEKPRRRFLYVGRIFYLKGIHDLISALPEDAELDIVGQCHEPEYLKRIKTMSEGKKIAFYDSLPDGEVLEKYRAAAAVVLPSLVDGGFTSAMEAMACAAPVLSTRVGSMPEVVADGETGFLVDAGDVEALREKLIFLKSNPEAVLAMGEKARQRVLDRFTWEKVAERCLEAYQS